MNSMKGSRGFSLVEMVVAVGLFAVVSIVCIATLVALVNADHKAQALQSVMNNLNVAVDGMARAMRAGSTYHCGGQPFNTWADCSTGGSTEVAFEPFGGNPQTLDQWVYQFVAPSGSNTGYIERSEDSGTTWERITAPEVSITDMKFFVAGSEPASANSSSPNTIQPIILMVVSGTAGTDPKATTSFHLQVSATQRELDI